MIATRFKYDYTLKDALLGAYGVFFGKPGNPAKLFIRLFPDSSIYYISHARLGIKFILKSFNLKEGSRIGVQPYTCSSVLSSITAAGYIPFYIDINDQLLLNTEDLAKKINQIDALIITHIFGFPDNMAAIKQIAGNIPVLEDCAHAMYSQYDKKDVGTFFDASVFSFDNGKFPSIGGGGLIVINNKKYDDYIRVHLAELPSPGIFKELKHIIYSFMISLIHSRIGYTITHLLFSEKHVEDRRKHPYEYPLPEEKGYKSIKYFLKYKIPVTEKRLKVQNANGAYLAKNLGDKFHILNAGDNFVNYYAFPILTKKRDEIFNYLKGKGIIAGKHFQYSLNWVTQFGYQKGDCPVFEKYAGQILTIPSNYSLKKEDLDLIIQALNNVSGDAA